LHGDINMTVWNQWCTK